MNHLVYKRTACFTHRDQTKFKWFPLFTLLAVWQFHVGEKKPDVAVMVGTKELLFWKGGNDSGKKYSIL